jgi:hypothetical protein
MVMLVLAIIAHGLTEKTGAHAHPDFFHFSHKFSIQYSVSSIQNQGIQLF